MATATFTMRMDSDLKSRLEAEASREDRSASWLAAQAIKMMLDEKAEKYTAIERALEISETEGRISEGAMRAWISSWGDEHELPKPGADIQPS
jgi:predicted transcriptional regulator